MKNRTIIITGANAGLGKDAARQLALNEETKKIYLACRSKDKAEAAKDRASHRIKIIKGHLKKIEQMIEEDRYCMDIIIQSLAAQKSLASLNKLLLENHLKCCITEKFKNGEEEKAIAELIKLYDLKERG